MFSTRSSEAVNSNETAANPNEPTMWQRIGQIVCTLAVIVTFPFSMWLCLHVIREYECGVVFRYGKVRFSEVLTPGLYFLLPLIDKCVVVDMRVAVFCLPKQEAHTKDGVCLKLDAVCTYQIVDALKSVLEVENVREIVKSLAHNMLCQAVGSQTLEQIARSTEQISAGTLEQLDATTRVWGIEIRHVEVRDLTLPKSILDTSYDAQDQAVMTKAAEIAKELRLASRNQQAHTSKKAVKST